MSENTFLYRDTKNYGHVKLISNMKTDDFIATGQTATNQEIDFFITIDPDPQHLKEQAKIFAINLRTNGAYDFPKLFGVKDGDDAEVLMEHMYIVSFLTAYHASLFPKTIGDGKTGASCFIGHAKMFSLATGGDFSITEQKVTTFVRVFHDDMITRKLKFILLMKHFNFLKKYQKYIPRIGEAEFAIPPMETLFNLLQTNYYAKRAGGEPDALSGQKPFVEGMNLKPIVPMDNEKGNLVITTLKYDRFLNVRTADQNPLMNTFYDEDGESFFFMEVNGNYSVEWNESFFLPIANFFTVEKERSSYNKIERYYKNYKGNLSSDHLLKSEVHSNTGIRPQRGITDSVRDRLNFDPFNGMPVAEIMDKFYKLPGLVDNSQLILEKVNNILSEFERVVREKDDTSPGKK